MKKKLKVIVIVMCIIVVLCGGLFGIIKIIDSIEAKQENEEQRQIMLLYQKVNYSISYATDYESRLEADGVYKKVPDMPDPEYNKYGIFWTIYIYLKYYERETGVVLAYETVVKYFSQEYEADGSLRLYNNGLHPEMEAYVDWMWGKSEEADNYERRLEGVYTRYFDEHKDEGFESQVFYSLSPQMYDELAKKEADPDYEMDLLSLQQQGY